MSADPHQLRDLADQAWMRYQQWLQRQSTLPRLHQFDLYEQNSAPSFVREWRGIWLACERELARVMAACQGGNA